MDTASWYRAFGQLEARGQSAVYEQWALGVAEDSALIALIDELPLQKRQPNLLFACARLLGAPEGNIPPSGTGSCRAGRPLHPRCSSAVRRPTKRVVARRCCRRYR